MIEFIKLPGTKGWVPRQVDGAMLTLGAPDPLHVSNDPKTWMWIEDVSYMTPGGAWGWSTKEYAMEAYALWCEKGQSAISSAIREHYTTDRNAQAKIYVRDGVTLMQLTSKT